MSNTKDFIELRKKLIEKDFPRLNNMQIKAVFHTEGPLLILAGAGSGKTTVLINRIANLLKYGNGYESDYAPEFICDEDMEFLEDSLSGNENDNERLRDLLSVNPPRP